MAVKRDWLRWMRTWFLMAVSLAVWSGLMGLLAPTAAASGGTTIQVPSQCSLVNAMQAAQDNNASNECGAGAMTAPYTIVLNPLGSPYVLTSANNDVDGPNGLPDVTQTVTVESSSSTPVVIERSTAVGTPAFRIFHVSAPLVSGASTSLGTTVPGVPGVTQVGSLTLKDVELENGLAQGGDGTDGGGGGLGAGGAIFSHGGDVTIDAGTLANNEALGGGGGTPVADPGGGGGMGAGGGSSNSNGYGGGGGGTETPGANATASANGAGGGPNGGAAGTSSIYGANGGYGGGGGGGSAGAGGLAWKGGNGGFGGGGGGDGGFGGYGGGGGSNSVDYLTGAFGGFGGGGGGGASITNGRSYGGNGSTTTFSGGGGAGLGGAVFALGGSLILTDSTFVDGVADGGTGGGAGATAGSGYGGAVFIDATNNGSTAYGATGVTFTGDTASTSYPDVYTYGTTVSPPPTSVGVAVTPGSVPAGGTATVAGTVYSASIPVSGAQVDLSLSRGDTTESTGNLGATSVLTNTSGAFSTTFTAPSDSGAVTVTASVYGSVDQAQTVVIVTPQTTPVQGTDTAQSQAGCGTVTASYADTSETGCGAGIFAVAQYGTTNPANTTALSGDVLQYFDAAVSTGNTFTSLTVTECNAQTGDTMDWWSPALSAWQEVSPAATLQGGCLQFNANSTSQPSLSDMYGTVFALIAQPVASGGGGISLAPVVSGVSPSRGPSAGSTVVTITGVGFTGATAVAFGGAAASSFTVDSDSQITATAPAGSGTVDVRVTTPYGTSPTDPADQFTYAALTMPGPAQACTASFPDVPSGYWAAQAIETLACKGIVNGFPDGTFQPDGTLTRAQFVKMLVLTLGLPPASGTTSFNDVPADAWYAPYVGSAVRAGVVLGFSQVQFDPNGTVTREQMAVLLARALKLTQAGSLSFSDESSIDAWAAQGVEEAVAAGYLNGFPDGAFQPLGPTTRAQAAKVLALVLQKQG